MSSARFVLLIVAIVPTAPRIAHGDDPVTLSDQEDRPPPCVDPSDVVGYRHCPRYGEWGENLLAPYVFVELGVNFRSLAGDASPTAVARTTGSTPTTGRSSSSGSLDARTIVERLGLGITRHLYVAGDVEFGHIDAGAESWRDMIVDGLLVLGVRAHVGPGAVAAEIAGGAMSYSTDTEFRTVGMAEARGRAYVWLSPWCTLGVVAGTSVLRDDRMAGVFVGFHSHSYAGDR